MTDPRSTSLLVEFECHGHRLALPLDYVRRALPCAETLPLPGAGSAVLGLLNVGGSVVAVLDLSSRLGLARAPVMPAQQILLLDLPDLPCGVLVDRIFGVSERVLDHAVAGALEAAPFVKGVLRLEDGLCLIVDPARFLFPAERAALEGALAGGADADH
jgi:purine-binding chemotaxis protein CheW